MKDENGLYYYPFPDNKRVRMYVKNQNGEVFFRLWNNDDKALWEEHGWVPYEAILEAAKKPRKGEFDPMQAYDLAVAKALIKNGE